MSAADPLPTTRSGARPGPGEDLSAASDSTPLAALQQLVGWPGALDLDALPWRGPRTPGVGLVPLHPPDLLERREPVDAVCLIRMAPGCSYGTHRHLGPEEVLVLAGGYRDEFGEHLAGAFVRYDTGSTHRPVAIGEPAPACVLLAVTRGGIVPVR